MSKKILIALGPKLMGRVDRLAVHECRTRSDLIREALRQYLENARMKGIEVDELPEPTITARQEQSIKAAKLAREERSKVVVNTERVRKYLEARAPQALV